MDDSSMGTCPIHRCVQIFASACRRPGEMFRRRGEKFRENCVVRHDRYGGGSVMVWAGITAHGRTDLVFVNGTLNAQNYRQYILARHVVPFIRANGGTFQQDNARPHVPWDNMDYLRCNNIDV